MEFSSEIIEGVAHPVQAHGSLLQRLKARLTGLLPGTEKIDEKTGATEMPTLVRRTLTPAEELTEIRHAIRRLQDREDQLSRVVAANRAPPQMDDVASALVEHRQVRIVRREQLSQALVAGFAHRVSSAPSSHLRVVPAAQTAEYAD